MTARLKCTRLGRVLSWPSGDVILSSLVGGGESERPRVTPKASLTNGVWPGQLYLVGQRAWSVKCWGVSYLKWPANVFHLSVFVLQLFKNIKCTLRSRAYRNRPQAKVCDLCQASSGHNSSPPHPAKKRARVGSWHPEGTSPGKGSGGGAWKCSHLGDAPLCLLADSKAGSTALKILRAFLLPEKFPSFWAWEDLESSSWLPFLKSIWN